MAPTRQRAILLLATLLGAFLLYRWLAADTAPQPGAHLQFDTAGARPPKTYRRIEINLADSADFEQLPGIGPYTAARIVRYRQRAGHFRSLAHFRQLRGLDSLYASIAQWVYLDSTLLPSTPSAYSTPSPHAPQPPSQPRNLNHVTETELLGYHLLPSHLARRVVRYGLAKGGYRHIAEVQRVYGITAAQYATVQRYFFVPIDSAATIPKHTTTKPRYTVVDVNQADSAALEALPGLGPTLSRRIVAYRSQLGFYHSPRQLTEVYGMRDSLLQLALPYLRVADTLAAYPHVHINTADVNILAAHPYIRYALAKRLVAYRKQHGSYRTVSDLQRLYGLDSTQLQRLLPYIRLD